MAHASIQAELPELPDVIKARLVPYRAAAIEEGLRGSELWHPGLFDAIHETIDLLEADPAVESVTVDYDEEDALYPATIWARTLVSLDDREALMERLDGQSDEILKRYPYLVLVAIL